MKPSESSSAPNTAATSATKPKNTKPTLSEAEYLQKQAADAKAAMSARLHDVTSALKGTVDITAWARQYPWIASGSALAAGFIAACAVVPANRDEPPHKVSKDRWGRVRDAWADVLHPKHDPEPKAPAPAEVEEPAPHAAPSSGWFGPVLREAIKVLRPLLMSFITNAMRTPQAAPNGHDADGEPGDADAARS